MAKRYYLCEVETTPDGDTQPVILSYPDKSATIEYSPDETMAFVCVETKNHARFTKDPRIMPLPDFPADGRVNGLSAAAQNALSSALSRFAVQISYSQSDGYREVLDRIGKKFNPNFSIDNFNAS
ncbi:hypothetical protein [Geoalkalibacter sp.]|uniref:hypothetical protein n=1 Tax=Geoalkalibacter sp. TaxID=3041440 RepID=UPI00272E1206|nr:hypothetical protein [Geoalkalibacter sp.]